MIRKNDTIEYRLRDALWFAMGHLIYKKFQEKDGAKKYHIQNSFPCTY